MPLPWRNPLLLLLAGLVVLTMPRMISSQDGGNENNNMKIGLVRNVTWYVTMHSFSLFVVLVVSVSRAIDRPPALLLRGRGGERDRTGGRHRIPSLPSHQPGRERRERFPYT